MRATEARKWASQGQRSKAIALLKSHLGGAEATRYPRLISEFRALLAELLLRDGDTAGAEAHAQATIALGQSIANSWQLVTAYKVMFEVAESRKDPVSALFYYRRYAEADKAYLNDVNARELAYQIVRQETRQKTQEIELLNRQNQVLHLQQQVDKQATQNTRLLVVLLLVCLALIGYWAYRIKRERPALVIAVNGGIATLEDAQAHLQHTDGVMLGRAAYHDPYLLHRLDAALFGGEVRPRAWLLRALRPYVEDRLAHGVALKHITRHLLGLFHGQPGGRAFRQVLSEGAHRAGADWTLVEQAIAMTESPMQSAA